MATIRFGKFRFNVGLTGFILFLSAGCSVLSAQSITDVWGGARSCIALCSDSSVWCWGFNWYGKLGDGSDTDRSVPIRVHGPNNVGYLSSVMAIMGGESHNMALKADSTVWCWGWNGMGQLGNNDSSVTESRFPVKVAGPAGVGYLHSVKVLGGRGYHSLAIKSDGTVWGWGFNRNGQLGNNDPAHANKWYSVQVQGLDKQAISASDGYDFSVALMSDGTLRSWGRNSTGQLGNNDSIESDVPVTVYGLTNVIQISCGWSHALALRADSTVWAWGGNATGQLGNGTHNFSKVPLQVPGLSSIVDVSGGDGSSLALKSDGTIWKWGASDTGHTQGGPNPTDRVAPVQVTEPSGMNNLVLARARDYHNVALAADGKVWAWGFNENGQCGDGTSANVKSVPVLVRFPWLSTVVKVSEAATNVFSLECVPNPFRSAIGFRLWAISREKAPDLHISDLSGRQVAKIVARRFGPTASYIWNAAGMPCGIYFARLAIEGKVLAKKILLVK